MLSVIRRPELCAVFVPQVWPEDLKDGSQDGYGVESVCDVAARIGGLVRSLEVKKTIVL